MDFKEEIIKLLKKEVNIEEITLEIPPNSELGDYAFPCFSLAKQFKKNPVQIAQELAAKIKPNKSIKEIKSVGPYLNFFVNKEKLSEDILKKIFEEKDKFGIQKKTNKTVLVEYPGPNTNKPLHLGHVRNICLGSALSNILEANGHKVIHVNINNDRGVHICKSMLAYKKWGNGDTPEKSKLKSDFFVGKYYVLYAQKEKEHPELEEEVQKMLELWEKGDKEIIALWKKMNQYAFDGFKETYDKFGLKFKKEYFESKTYKYGKDIVLDGLKTGVFFKKDDGAIAVDLKEQGFGEKVLLRANGTAVYVTQDLYLAKLKYDDFKYDKSIYVVATEQNHHFKVLFEILKLLKFPFAEKCYHFAYGMVNLTTGKMKSREGTVVDADNLIEEVSGLASDETKKRNEKIDEKELKERANKIALGAIRFYILRYDPMKDILFDPKESISFEGETGPYLQYTYARINSIIEKNTSKTKKLIDTSLLLEKEELEIIKLLSGYEEIVKKAGEDYRINTVARYLLDLAQAFNNFYHMHPVLKAEDELKEARLLLIKCVQQVIKNGLSLLGIEILDRM
jgi:arginyl-tRNA synthetase